MTIKAQIFAHDVGIGVEATTPEAIANEDSGRSVESLLVGRKFAAQHGGNSPDLKETGGDPRPSYPFRQSAGGLGNILAVIAGERLEGGIEAIPVFKTNRSNQMEWAGSFRIVLVDAHKLIGVWEREGLEEDGIDSGEDGTVCANGKGQGEHDGGREGWGFTDEAKGGFDIGHSGVQVPDAVDFADFLFNLFTPAEFHYRPPSSLFGCHPLGDVVIGQLFDMKAKLLIQLRVESAFAKKLFPPVHGELLFGC